MIPSANGVPTQHPHLRLAATTDTPLKSQKIRILAKLRFISLGNRAKPPVAKANDILTRELNAYLDTHLGEFNFCDSLTVTDIQDIESSSNMNTCPVHAYAYMNTQQVDERSHLRDVLEEAHASLDMLSTLLEAKPDWRLFYNKPYLAPLQGEGFGPWLHNAIVTADVNSTLTL